MSKPAIPPVKIDYVARKTGKPIATRLLNPTVKVPPELSRAKLNDLGEEKIAQVRTMLIDLPKDKWEPTFRSLFTTGEK